MTQFSNRPDFRSKPIVPNPIEEDSRLSRKELVRTIREALPKGEEAEVFTSKRKLTRWLENNSTTAEESAKELSRALDNLGKIFCVKAEDGTSAVAFLGAKTRETTATLITETTDSIFRNRTNNPEYLRELTRFAARHEATHTQDNHQAHDSYCLHRCEREGDAYAGLLLLQDAACGSSPFSLEEAKEFLRDYIAYRNISLVSQNDLNHHSSTTLDAVLAQDPQQLKEKTKDELLEISKKLTEQTMPTWEEFKSRELSIALNSGTPAGEKETGFYPDSYRSALDSCARLGLSTNETNIPKPYAK